jgi:hypothetical protein
MRRFAVSQSSTRTSGASASRSTSEGYELDEEW